MGYGAKGEIAQSLSINSLAKNFFPVDTAIIPQWILFSPVDTAIIPQWILQLFPSGIPLILLANSSCHRFLIPKDLNLLRYFKGLKKEENVVKKK